MGVCSEERNSNILTVLPSGVSSIRVEEGMMCVETSVGQRRIC